MSYIFTSESVSEGHPDKIADQISDAILDAFLALDKNSKVACEVMVTTGQVIVSGEVNSSVYVDIQKVVRNQIRKIGYDNSDLKFDYKSCGILTYINEQSPDIAMGVHSKNPKFQGAGDQGIMFGYANKDTESFIPMTLDLSHKILIELADIRKSGYEMTYLRPDAKCQVTIQYNNQNQPEKIISIVLSTQHDDFDSDEVMLKKIKDDIKNILIPKIRKQNDKYSNLLSDVNIKYLINPTGKFVIGGPFGDTGLTGRKIIVDSYGGRGAHGGGAFSGKDSSKVDRSAAYAARHLAKNIVASGIADECLIQISYAIGKPDPLSLYINTYGTNKLSITDSEISSILFDSIDLTPFGIVERLKLKSPIYTETASYGHFGRTPMKTVKDFSFLNKKINKINVDLFTWEKLDYVDLLTQIFKDFSHEK